MTREEQLNKLVDPNQTQVFVCTSPSNLPISFGAHPWFVINRKGKLSRWEILHRKVRHGTVWGHLVKDFFRPFQGIEVIFSVRRFCWRAKHIATISGVQAEQLATLIENSPNEYPACYNYFLLGPNSNTYVQTLLDSVPTLGIKLPFNCFGRDHIHEAKK